MSLEYDEMAFHVQLLRVVRRSSDILMDRGPNQGSLQLSVDEAKERLKQMEAIVAAANVILASPPFTVGYL